MADETDKQAPKDTDEVAANAEGKKNVRRAAVDPEKVDPITNQKLGDFLRTSADDDPKLKDAIARSDAEIVRGNPDARLYTANAIADMTARDAEQKESAKANLDLHTAEPANVQVPLEIWRARENARIKAEATEKQLDETVPGGRFYENGRWVNCDGRPID